MRTAERLKPLLQTSFSMALVLLWLVLVLASELLGWSSVDDSWRCWPEPKLDEVLGVLGPARPQERIQRAHRALEENAFAGHWYFQAYLAKSALGNEEVAREDLRNAIANDPDNSVYWGALAEFHHRKGDWPAGIKAAREQVRLDPDNPVGRCLLARLLEMGDQLEEASSEYKACKSKASKLPNPKCTVVSTSGWKGDLFGNPTDAYFPPKLWDRDLIWNTHASLVLVAPIYDGPCRIMVAFNNRGVLAAAENETVLVPNLVSYAQAAQRRIHGYGKAKPPAGSMAASVVTADFPHFGLECPSYAQLQGIVDDVRRNLTQARNPIWAYWHAQAAWGYFEQGNRIEALKHIQEGLRADSESLLLLLAGARITTDIKEAQAYLDQALRLAPGSPWVHFRLAEVGERTGNPPVAIRHYREALKNWKDPGDIVFSDDWKEIRNTVTLRDEAAKRLARLEPRPAG